MQLGFFTRYALVLSFSLWFVIISFSPAYFYIVYILSVIPSLSFCLRQSDSQVPCCSFQLLQIFLFFSFGLWNDEFLSNLLHSPYWNTECCCTCVTTTDQSCKAGSLRRSKAILKDFVIPGRKWFCYTCWRGSFLAVPKCKVGEKMLQKLPGKLVNALSENSWIHSDSHETIFLPGHNQQTIFQKFQNCRLTVEKERTED